MIERRTLARAVSALLVLLLVTACEGITNPVTDETEPGLVEVPVDDRCADVEEELLGAVEEGLAVPAALTGAYAVSSEAEDVTFLAAEVEGEGHPEEPPIGIWAVRGDLQAAEPDILAVNAVAREVSEWPFDEDITEKVDGGEEAHACVDGAAQ